MHLISGSGSNPVKSVLNIDLPNFYDVSTHSMNTEILTRVDYLKYLGVIVDQNPGWSSHFHAYKQPLGNIIPNRKAFAFQGRTEDRLSFCLPICFPYSYWFSVIFTSPLKKDFKMFRRWPQISGRVFHTAQWFSQALQSAFICLQKVCPQDTCESCSSFAR